MTIKMNKLAMFTAVGVFSLVIVGVMLLPLNHKITLQEITLQEKLAKIYDNPISPK